jgi:hypothetical protein
MSKHSSQLEKDTKRAIPPTLTTELRKQPVSKIHFENYNFLFGNLGNSNRRIQISFDKTAALHSSLVDPNMIV